tara:strand:+ start:480 stop:758 length:279 start_codon:yes stop_codon:yes gene_type:complete
MDEKIFKMPESITFYTVKDVLVQLKQNLSRVDEEKWVIDLHGVVHFDSAGLALLIEAKRMASNDGVLFKVEGVPKKLEALAQFCGVDVVLND